MTSRSLNPTAYPVGVVRSQASIRLRGRISAEAARRRRMNRSGRWKNGTSHARDATALVRAAARPLPAGREPGNPRAPVRGAAARARRPRTRHLRRQRHEPRAGAGRRRASRSCCRRTCSGAPSTRRASASWSAPRATRRSTLASCVSRWRPPGQERARRRGRGRRLGAPGRCGSCASSASSPATTSFRPSWVRRVRATGLRGDREVAPDGAGHPRRSPGRHPDRGGRGGHDQHTGRHAVRLRPDDADARREPASTAERRDQRGVPRLQLDRQGEEKPDLTVEYLFYEQGTKGLHFFNKVKPQQLNDRRPSVRASTPPPAPSRRA